MNSTRKLIQISLPPVILLLAVLALYSGSLNFPLVFDDGTFFDNPANISTYGHFAPVTRWLAYASLAWTVDWFGVDVFWLRLGNVLLHAGNAIALFFLLKRLFHLTLTSNSIADKPSHLTWYAFFGALIFALHPVAVYGVVYLVQRSTLMATLFVLLMARTYLEGLVSNNWKWMIAAVLFYIAAISAKEHSITAAGIAVALTFLVRKPSPALLRLVMPYAVMLLLIAIFVAYLFKSKGILGAAYEPNALMILNSWARLQGVSDLPNVYILSILTQGTLFFKYLYLWLLPNPAWMSVDMREPFALSLLNWRYISGFVAYLAYFCIAVWLLLKQGRKGLLGFSMLFPWILFLTEFSTVRIQEPFVLYRSYMWMAGLYAALPVLFSIFIPQLPNGPSTLAAATGKSRNFPEHARLVSLCIICMVLIPLSWNRMTTFSSALSLWDDAEKLVRHSPSAYGAERIYYNRGTELGQLRRYDEAISDFSKAISIHPFDFMYGNRAAAYFFTGRYPEALQDYDHAIALNPNNPNSYYGRATVEQALGKYSESQEDFRKSCMLGLCR